MRQRHWLSKQFIESLRPPEQGELWISDTEVRGFGFRMWTYGKSTGVAFAIRTTSKNGKTIRKTFDPWSAYRSLSLWIRDESFEFDESGRVRLANLVPEAREWAATEIGRLKGKLPSEEELRGAQLEYEQMCTRASAQLSEKTLEQLVEIVLSCGNSRGWTEEYRDRLRRAFNAFAQHNEIRHAKVSELDDGRVVDWIEKSQLGPGNLRSLRSLLNVVFRNLHDLGGPVYGRVLPDWRGIKTSSKTQNCFLDELSRADIDKILPELESIDANWRARYCIELCLRLWAPQRRVMSAMWSSLVDTRWFPYFPDERVHWFRYFNRIHSEELICLQKCREQADAENIVSPYWFPSLMDSSRAIANIDRPWASLLDRLGWPALSVNQVGKRFRQVHLFDWWNGRDIKETERIERELGKLTRS